MSLLSNLTKLSKRKNYLPFSEPAIQPGKYLYKKAGRAFLTSSPNTLSTLFKTYLSNKYVLPLPTRYAEDRRRWTPDKHPLTTTGGYAKITDITIPMKDSPNEWVDTTTGEITWKPRITYPAQIPRKGNPRARTQLHWEGFRDAEKVWICLKRKARQEVLHALGQTGKTGQKSPRFNMYSQVRCW